MEDSVLGVIFGGFPKVPILKSGIAWAVGVKSSSGKVSDCLRCDVGVEVSRAPTSC